MHNGYIHILNWTIFYIYFSALNKIYWILGNSHFLAFSESLLHFILKLDERCLWYLKCCLGRHLTRFWNRDQKVFVPDVLMASNKKWKMSSKSSKAWIKITNFGIKAISFIENNRCCSGLTDKMASSLRTDKAAGHGRMENGQKCHFLFIIRKTFFLQSFHFSPQVAFHKEP